MGKSYSENMKQSLESLGNQLSIPAEKLERTAPGAFVTYCSIRRKSSHIELASDSGIIKKQKKRTPEKAIYEFLSLEIWDRVLREYSKYNNLRLRSPQPIGLTGLETDSPSVLMEFLKGYEIKKLNELRRTTPVNIRGQKKYPLPLYPACALHLGALNMLKEVEGLYHSDYDLRHIIFSPVRDVSIGVVDLENSRRESPINVGEESKKIRKLFNRITCSPRDTEVLDSWYDEGRQSLILPDNHPIIEKIIEEVIEEHGIDMDYKNVSLDGHHLRYKES